MVFLSVFWAYAHSSLSPALEIGGCWPKIVIFIFCYYLFNFTKQLNFFQILYITEKTYKSLLLELKLKTNIIIFFLKN
jgi:hypothetical protein